MTDKNEITPEFLADLKAKAEKAMPGPWELDETPTDIGTYYEVYSTDWRVADCEKDGASAAYIAAANPTAILGLIANYERLQKEYAEFKDISSYPEIFNDPQALTKCYFAGRMAEGREKNKEIDILLDENKQLKEENKRLLIEAHDLDSSGGEMAKDLDILEKEADWLATRLEERDIADHLERRIEIYEMSDKADWREAARKAVEAQCKHN